MTLAVTISGVFLALVCAATAVADFRRAPTAVDTVTRLGIPAGKLALLGAIKALAAAGIVVGFAVDRVHVVVGVCLVVYFAIAVTTHVRVRDGARNTAPAFVMLVVAVAFTLAAVGS